MAPRIEFNASDAILALALRTGQQRSFNTRFAQGQQLITNARNAQAQQEALRLEKQRLNLAATQQRQGVTATRPSRSISNPFSQSVAEANAVIKAPNALGLDEQTQAVLEVAERNNDRDTIARILGQALDGARRPVGSPGAGEISGGNTAFTIDNAGNLAGTEGGKELTELEIRQRGGFVGPGQPQQPVSVNQQFKQELLNNIPNLPEDARLALQPLVQDEGVTSNQLLLRARQFSVDPVSTGQNVQIQQQNIGFQVKDQENQIKRIEEGLREEGINILGRDDEAILADIDARTSANAIGFGAQPEKRQLLRNLFFRLREAEVAKEQLRQQQQGLVPGLLSGSNATTPIAPQTNVPDGSDVTALSDDELRRIAGF